MLYMICRVGQNRIWTLYMTVYLVKSLQNISYVHRIYMVLANPMHVHLGRLGRIQSFTASGSRIV